MELNYPVADNNTTVYMTQLMLLTVSNISNLMCNKHHVKAIKTIINCKFLSHFLNLLPKQWKLLSVALYTFHYTLLKDNSSYLRYFFPFVISAYNPAKRCFWILNELLKVLENKAVDLETWY